MIPADVDVLVCLCDKPQLEPTRFGNLTNRFDVSGHDLRLDDTITLTCAFSFPDDLTAT